MAEEEATKLQKTLPNLQDKDMIFFIFLQTECRFDQMQFHMRDTSDGGSPNSFGYNDCRIDDSTSQLQPVNSIRNTKICECYQGSTNHNWTSV